MKTRFSGVVAMAAAAALAGCAETADDRYGSLEAAVVSTGSDGATYRLPAGAYVFVYNSTFGDSYSLDGDDAVVSVEVPVGDYSVLLAHPNGYATEWPLERTNVDMSTETVTATLLTPQPVAVTVLEDQTSSLVFQFQVVDGGTVTFAHGTIDISIDVDEVESTHGRAKFSADNYVKSWEYFDPSSPADLVNHVPAVGDTIVHEIRFAVSDDWIQTSSYTACASASLLGGLISLSHFETTFEAWVGGTARFCVYGGPFGPWVTVSSTRQGAAERAVYQSFGDYEYYFNQAMWGFLPDPIFDGQNLDVDAMTGTFTVPMYLYTNVWAAPTGTGNFTQWYADAFSSPAATFEFVPQL